MIVKVLMWNNERDWCVKCDLSERIDMLTGSDVILSERNWFDKWAECYLMWRMGWMWLSEHFCFNEWADCDYMRGFGVMNHMITWLSGMVQCDE